MSNLKDEETIVGNLLRWGVVSAAFITAFGGILYLLHYGKALPDYSIFQGEPSDYTTFRGVLSATFAFHRRGFIQLGLIALILTPLARVAFLTVTFFRQRDLTYVFLSLTVFILLTFSLFGF